MMMLRQCLIKDEGRVVLAKLYYGGWWGGCVVVWWCGVVYQHYLSHTYHVDTVEMIKTVMACPDLGWVKVFSSEMFFL